MIYFVLFKNKKDKDYKMFRTRFWGVRGSIACPNNKCMKYGGNTSCVSVECGADLIIFDTGSGIRSLGNYMLEEKINKASIMFSHTHWDHINGFPFFKPAYTSGTELSVFCGNFFCLASQRERM